MAVIINGDTGIDKITDGSVVQADLAGGGLYPKVPAFSAEMNGNQSVTGAVATKIAFSVEIFDTNSNYDTSLYRFTPTVAGYYDVNLSLMSNNGTLSQVHIYKNGSQFKTAYPGTANDFTTINVSALIYMNGTTDYLEGYGYQISTGEFRDLNAYSFFDAHLVSV